jgi:ribosomal protein L23
LGVKETQHTVVFEVAAAATKTEIKEAVQQIFKLRFRCAHRELHRQDAPRGQNKATGALEEGVRSSPKAEMSNTRRICRFFR